MIHWLVKEPIDAKEINAQRHELSRSTLDSEHIDEKKFGSSIDTTIITNYNDLPIGGIERMKEHEAVRINVGYSGIKNPTGSSIGLVFEGKSDKAFYRAHSIFSPDSLISILIGEISIKQIRAMIRDSRTLSMPME